jgi:hypothetical protein
MDTNAFMRMVAEFRPTQRVPEVPLAVDAESGSPCEREFLHVCKNHTCGQTCAPSYVIPPHDSALVQPGLLSADEQARLWR